MRGEMANKGNDITFPLSIEDGQRSGDEAKSDEQ
jgi:hypothetical protein